jgi:radical SAM-linked protein
VSWWLVRYERRGPAAYVSHLDTTRALQRCFARAGVVLALSQGMRPKPRISVVVPLPVGAAAADELVVVEVDDESTEPTPREALPRLRAAAAGGLQITSLTVVGSRPRPVATQATYRCRVDLDAGAARAAAAAFSSAATIPVERRSPKGVRTLDLKEYVSRLDVEDEAGQTRLEFDLVVTPAGTARPAEVVAEVARRCDAPTRVRDLERLGVRFRDLPRDGVPAATRETG